MTLYQVSYKHSVFNLLQVGQGLVEMGDEKVLDLAWLSSSIVVALTLALVMTRSISHVCSVRFIYAWNALVIIIANAALMNFGSPSRFPDTLFDPGAFWAVSAAAAWYSVHFFAMSPALRAHVASGC